MNEDERCSAGDDKNKIVSQSSACSASAYAVAVVVSSKPGRCDRASRGNSKRMVERLTDSGRAGLEDNAHVESSWGQ